MTVLSHNQPGIRTDRWNATDAKFRRGGLGLTFGGLLLLGGSLTEYLSWRWVLFVNVPIAIAVLLGTGVLVDGERERGSLAYAINRTSTAGWTDARTIGFLVLGAVLLPAQLVAGVGLGLAFVATTIVGVRGVAEQHTGVASGLINTTQQIGGALGLAVLATVAVTATRSQPPGLAGLTHGYTVGVLTGGVCYLAAIIVAALMIKADR